MRLKRKYEKKMWELIKEVAYYAAFLLLVCFIAWGQHDGNIFKSNQKLMTTFHDEPGIDVTKQGGKV